MGKENADSNSMGTTATTDSTKSSRKKKKRKKVEPRDENSYIAPMAKSRFAMNLKVLCRKLEMEMEDVVNCYIIGSRIWGTATSKSDWDMIVVIKNKKKMKKQGTTLTVDNIDAKIWDIEEWIEELKAHRFACWLTLFLPINAIWKQESSIDTLENVGGFSMTLFVDKLVDDVGKDCHKLNKFWTKGKMDRVHRTFVHSLRMIEISKQILHLMKERYSVIDIKCSLIASDAFVGSINFKEIDQKVREKKEEMVNRNGHSVDPWIAYLKGEAVGCKALLK